MRRSQLSTLALPVISPVTCLVISLIISLAAVPGAASADSPAMLQVAAYDVTLVDRALEDQAWVVLQAAIAHARQHGGRYPGRVADLVPHLPRNGRMANVWTGEANVPTDASARAAGEIEYRAIEVHGQPVGCRVVAIGRFGASVVLVSDPQRRREPLPDTGSDSPR